MKETMNLVTVGKVAVFGFLTETPQGVRLKTSAEEFDRLELEDGMTVTVESEDFSRRSFFVACSEFVEPGWRLVTLCVLARRATQPKRTAVGT